MTISVTRDGVYKKILLNRPDRRNALDAATVESLIVALVASADDGTRLLQIVGAGRNTCAGFDMSDVEKASEGDLVLRFIRIEILLQLIYHAPFHTLALAHGRVVGAGADIVLACRHRIGTPDSHYEMPGAGFGIVLGTGRLGRAVGATAAADLLSGAFDADKGLRTGFLTKIATQEEWAGATTSLLERATNIDQETDRALLRNLRSDHGVEDMAELVASASRPGLKDRIAAYIAARTKIASK